MLMTPKGVLFRTADKEIYRGIEYFERVLNYKETPNSLQVDQDNDMNIGTGARFSKSLVTFRA